MRYQKDFSAPIEKRFYALGISVRAFSDHFGFGDTYLRLLFRGGAVASPKFFSKLIAAILKVERWPYLASKLRAITAKDRSLWARGEAARVRDRQMIKMRKTGAKLHEIGKIYGISKQRVQAIVSEYEKNR